MSDNVILIGAGGHAKVIADIIRCRGDRIIGYLDDNVTGDIDNIPVLGTTSGIARFTSRAGFFVAIGNAMAREKIMAAVTSAGGSCYTAIHPTAVIAQDTTIAPGTAIMANAVINSGSIVGRGVIINTGATIDHDNRIGDFCHIAPGAHLSGTVQLGKSVWVGTGAAIINNVSICANTTVGAGAAVTHDITTPGVYVGVPARLLRKE